MEVICALVPRFSLIAACGERRELLREPAALAPEPGAKGAVGEVSGAAEAHGVRAGMPLGEALSRCPELSLVPPDPGRAMEIWEGALRRLEGIGAGSSPSGPARRSCAPTGCGGSTEASREPWRRPGGRWRCRPGSLRRPTRFASYAAALSAPRRRRPRAAGRGVPRRREPVVSAAGLGRFLSPLPVSILADRLGPDEHSGRRLVGVLERLGLTDAGSAGRAAPG